MTMDVAACIDPQIAAALAASPMGSFDFGTFTVSTHPADPEMMANMPAVDLPPTTTESCEVVVPGDRWPTRPCACTRRRRKASGRPCVYWIHGGGYLFGSGLKVDARINRWVEEFDCIAVSIDYRLAPRTRTRRRSTTATPGCCGPRGNADELGIDPERIAIAGASAGGGLAAGLAILARDRGEVRRAFQLLDLSDDRRTQHDVSSHIDGRADLESRPRTSWGGGPTSGELVDKEDVPGYAVPAGSRPLRGCPRVDRVGSLDVFRDEDIEYASRLLATGIPTELHMYPGACHGFEMIVPNSAIAQACRARHHRGVAPGTACRVRLRVHQLTPRVSALTTSTMPAARR